MNRALVLLAALATSAHADPSNGTLVAVGLGMAPVDYLAGVSIHEGSHALAAKLVGADVTELHLFPPGTDPHTHHFRFGWTYVQGLRSNGDRAFFYVAPKITDTLALGALSAVILTSAWPKSRYGELALTVAATGFWVDFSKDVFLFSPINDVSQFERVTCLRGWRRAVSRSVYGLAAAGMAAPVAYAYYKTFSRASPSASATPLVLPLVAMRF